jgi:serine/threonine protein kinase/putative intracellular protease/amidase
MTVAVCPNSETLAAFARGDLTPTELAAIAEHIGGCDACCRALKFVPEDSLAHLARAAAAVPATLNSANTDSPREEAASNKSELPAKRIPAGFADHPRYRIINELGAGGMGTVYKAEDLLMGRIIALKVVSPHLTAKASVVARFRREICAVAQLKDHRIVTTHDAGEAGGAHFLVMEFVEGVSLDRLVSKKGPLPVTMACLFTRQAALGLQHAAEKGLIHRDIKPQNLMVTKKGQVKILDFGLARFARSDEDANSPTVRVPFGAGKAPQDAGVTNPNMLMGTPDYLSPEQAKNSHAVDARSDIYSLGCTLYFLLTGKPPFLGSATLLDKLLAHTNDEPTAIRELRPEVPEGLAEVLAKMMAKKPEDRYQKASEAAAAILPFTRSNESEPVFEIVDAAVVNAPQPVAATPAITPTPVVRVIVEAASDTTPPRDVLTLADTPRPKRVKKKKRVSFWRRRKWAVIGGAAALLLLVGVVIAASGKKLADKGNEKPTDAKANTPNKSDRANPGNKGTPDIGNTVISPLKGNGKIQILYALPSNGVFLGDFVPVRDRLVEKGATVITTSTDGGTSTPHFGSPGQPVPIHTLMRADMKLDDYSAVVFAGANIDEYVFTGRGSFAARDVMKRMQDSNKVVAGICVGTGVLANHGMLRRKDAAHSRHLFDRFPPPTHPFFTGDKAEIKWGNRPEVVTDGNIVTASGEREAVPFADAILAAINAK